MIIVFAVLFLVFVIGKMIIKTFSSYEIQNSSSPDVEKLLDKKIKNLSGGKGKIIKYTKIN